MSDQRLRDLERTFHAGGSSEDLTVYLAERLRTDGDLVLRLIRRVIALERNVPNTMNLPIEDAEILDFLDNDRKLPTTLVPSVFIPGVALPPPTITISDGSGFDNLPSETIASPAMDEFRVRNMIREEPVRLHAHFHCMKPGCAEQVVHDIYSPSEASYYTPLGWSRTGEMLLCSMHSSAPAQICDQELGGHVHPEYPPTNQTYSCARCNYGPLYPS